MHFKIDMFVSILKSLIKNDACCITKPFEVLVIRF